MTVLAVIVHFLRLIMTGFLVRFILVLVRMMAKMERCAFLVLTIHCRSGPGVLGRQQEHQNDEDELFHDADNSTIERVKPARAQSGER